MSAIMCADFCDGGHCNKMLPNGHQHLGFAWQVIEFESTALMIGHLGVRVSLIAYPVVSIKKAPSPSSSSWLHGQTCLWCSVLESCLVRAVSGAIYCTSLAYQELYLVLSKSRIYGGLLCYVNGHVVADGQVCSELSCVSAIQKGCNV